MWKFFVETLGARNFRRNTRPSAAVTRACADAVAWSEGGSGGGSWAGCWWRSLSSSALSLARKAAITLHLHRHLYPHLHRHQAPHLHPPLSTYLVPPQLAQSCRQLTTLASQTQRLSCWRHLCATRGRTCGMPLAAAPHGITATPPLTSPTLALAPILVVVVSPALARTLQD